jgi:hypothetical protein
MIHISFAEVTNERNQWSIAQPLNSTCPPPDAGPTRHWFFVVQCGLEGPITLCCELDAARVVWRS